MIKVIMSNDLSMNCTYCFLSFDVEPVGKQKYDPNAEETKAVSMAVGTGCGGFLGYFSLIIIPRLSYCLSTEQNNR